MLKKCINIFLGVHLLPENCFNNMKLLVAISNDVDLVRLSYNNYKDR